jgi:hypothetical protein
MYWHRPINHLLAAHINIGPIRMGQKLVQHKMRIRHLTHQKRKTMTNSTPDVPIVQKMTNSTPDQNRIVPILVIFITSTKFNLVLALRTI